MPLVTFQKPAGVFSGKLGSDENGIVYYVVDGRGIAREFTVAVQPNSTDQQLVRAVFTSLSAAYTTLSQPQIEAWRTFALNFNDRDRLGRRFKLNALQAFQRVNSHRLFAGQSVLSDPPLFSNPASPLLLNSVAADAVNSELAIAFQHNNASGFWRVRLSPALDSPTRLARKGEIRAATVNIGDAYFAVAATPQTIAIPYADLKSTYAAGDFIGIEILALTSDYVPGQTLLIRRFGIS